MTPTPDFLRAAPAELARQVLRRDPTARPWIEGLPHLWEHLSPRWHLTSTGSPRHGGTSLVLPVLAAGRPAAVKLCSPITSAALEAAALNAFAGRGAVQLYAADLEHHALLLQWLPGPALTALTDPVHAVEVAGDIAKQLSRAEPPPDAPSLGARAEGWREQLTAQHHYATCLGTAFPTAFYAVAVEAIEAVARDRTPSLTHGDLAAQNIVGTAAGDWVSIDATLMTGNSAYEAHTVVRSYLSRVLEAAVPNHVEGQLVRRFADAAGVDPDLARVVSFARYLSSYYWESQNSGDASTVERLRQVCAAIGAELTSGGSR